MEKNRIRPVKAGKGMRMSYSRQKEVLEMPNLIEVQKDSYQWFLKEGLKEVFDDISPIADYSGHLSLDFVDFTLCENDVKYTIPECKERDATYAAPLKVKVRLHNKETDEINEHEIFMGDLPLMTETGTFVINGAERVIVSQLVRSPGIYYGIAHDKVGKTLYSCTVIPNRGAWLEYETDSNDVFYVRVDRTRKVPITVLIRALGVGSNQEIIDMFGEEPKILASFVGPDMHDIVVNKQGNQISFDTVENIETYVLYRNGEKIATLTEPAYLDTKAKKNGKKYSYSVSVISNGQESDPSNEVSTYYLKKNAINILINGSPGKMTFTWNRNKKADGYEIQYGTSKTFAGAKTLRIAKKNLVISTTSNMRVHQSYYVRVRSYKTLGQQKYYSEWSKAKKLRINR